MPSILPTLCTGALSVPILLGLPNWGSLPDFLRNALLLGSSIFNCDQGLCSEQPYAPQHLWPCFPLLAFCLLLPGAAPCLSLKAKPSSHAAGTCMLHQHQSSWLSLLSDPSTTSLKVSRVQGFWWETVEILALCRPVTPFIADVHSTKLLCKIREPCFSCIWQHEENVFFCTLI